MRLLLILLLGLLSSPLLAYFSKDVAIDGYRYKLPILIDSSIRLAHGTIEAYYPKLGTKERELYGSDLYQASRYEQLRKNLYSPENIDSMMLQERVFESLCPELRSGFLCTELSEKLIRARDDETTRRFALGRALTVKRDRLWLRS